MGRLRRKIDGATEAPMIRNVRGVGFVLDAVPLSQGSAKKHDDEIVASRVPVSSCLPLGRNYFCRFVLHRNDQYPSARLTRRREDRTSEKEGERNFDCNDG
jgi:hypothetical protein